VNDPYEDPKFRAWARRVKDELVPQIDGSDVVVSVVCNPADIDPKFAVELGVAVMLGKPIIAVIEPGTRIPDKLARVVDDFVELNRDCLDSTSDGIREAIQRILDRKAD